MLREGEGRGYSGRGKLPEGGPHRPSKAFLNGKEKEMQTMRKRGLAIVVGVSLVAIMASTGCVTKKLFRKNVEDTNTRVTGVESAVEANERRLGDLGRETDSKIASVKTDAQRAQEIGSTALTEAKNAEKLAKGKILWTITLSDDRVKFSFDQAKVPPAAAELLDDLAASVKEMNKSVYVEIEGHTDNIGSDQYNLRLGEKRAMAVLNYLHEKGSIPLHAINVISYGESKPVAENKTSKGRSQNRRVVVRVLE